MEMTIEPASRRTHGVYHTQDEAVKAAQDLACLMNGVPTGFVFCTLRKMGAVALVSYKVIPA